MVNQRSVPYPPPGQFLNNAIPRSDQTEDDYPSFSSYITLWTRPLHPTLLLLVLPIHPLLNHPVLVSLRKWWVVEDWLLLILEIAYVLLHTQNRAGQEQVLKYNERLILYSEWMARPQEPFPDSLLGYQYTPSLVACKS